VSQSLSYFHGSLNWQTWQTGFLFVFSVQLDGEKPDKITRGACACNDDKVIFENLSLACGGHMSEYATVHPLGWLFTDSKKLGEPDGSPCCLIDQIVFAADSARTLLLRADGG
jgi:hypothetical protein